MKNATRDFIKLLLSDTTHPLYVCSLTNEKSAGGERHVHTRDIQCILDFCEKWDVQGRGVYYCVSTINGPRRAIETAAETPFLFVDIDFKDIDLSPAEIGAIVNRLPIVPTRQHLSGNGIHALWQLDRSLTDPHKAAQLLKQLCSLLGGDPHVCHPAALLRMPGTHNSKFSQWREVTVTRDIGKVYSLEAIEELRGYQGRHGGHACCGSCGWWFARKYLLVTPEKQWGSAFRSPAASARQ